VKVTVHDSNVPFGTKLMIRGYPKGENAKENLTDRYFVVDTYEGDFKVCTGGVNMEQWGVHGVKANKSHENYVVQGSHAGAFQMDFHLGHIFEDVEPAPVTRVGTTRGGGATRGGEATRGGGGPTRSYAAQYHNAGNSGHSLAAPATCHLEYLSAHAGQPNLFVVSPCDAPGQAAAVRWLQANYGVGHDAGHVAAVCAQQAALLPFGSGGSRAGTRSRIRPPRPSARSCGWTSGCRARARQLFNSGTRGRDSCAAARAWKSRSPLS